MAAVPADFLVSKIVSLVENEAELLGGARDDLEEIKRELLSMRSFLEDADMKRPHMEGEKTWVASVRDLVYDVEDIIDEFMYLRNKRFGRHESARKLYKMIGFPKYLWEKHQIASRLQKIKSLVKSIPERSQRYGVYHVEGSSSSNNDIGTRHGESSLFITDDELVGIEDERELLVGWLTNGGQQRTTISVVGMGGSGKTTLVAKAYNSQAVKHHFDCYAWITVSQAYVIEDLFRSLIKQFYQAAKEAVPMELSSMNYQQLVEMLVNYLEPKRYIVVLDDVWNSNLWNQIKVSLPNGLLGSRVVLTTRNGSVASLFFEVGSCVHHIQPLPEKEAWALFCMKAFSRNSNNCPSELEILGKKIVAKCQGLPLAIVSLGGLLSARRSESEWKMVCNSIIWELHNNQMLQAVKSILLLSYNDLPYRLKRCFLYCGLFPEDYEIKRKRVTRLWMAEGFVEQVRGIAPEEVAEGYLLELIRRSMLQSVEKNSSGLPKACKMHDLLREVALSISEEEKFFCVYDEQKEGAREDGIARRLSVQAIEKEAKSFRGKSQLRSLFLFVTDVVNPYSLASGFKLLRVLDLEDCPVENLPDDIVSLFNLRYLNLKRTLLKELPKSIGRLQNLETLNIDDTNIEALPKGIVKLQKLRYLLARRLKPELYNDFNYVSGVQVPSNLACFKNLQVLGCVESNKEIMIQVKSMTQLVRLDLCNVHESYETDLCFAIQNMQLLGRLFVMASSNQVLRMDALKKAPPSLRRLTLVGKLEKIPQWFHTLENLRVLYLHWSSLSKNPTADLSTLPNLRCLTLVKAYEGNFLHFFHGFKNLEILELLNFPYLTAIKFAEGVMPHLKELSIGNCDKLMMIPRDIVHLTNLQQLTLVNIPNQVTQRIRAPYGVDCASFRHIPKINHVNFTSSGWSQQSLS
ncbi:disease resistance protein RPM1 [Mercurialis annua]|uniref:disease resistance protein RPM1 n=1 Tax=Mercurialis annua TaxID=3986 RepID=UPI002160EB41|nr:disease resistance protein RPM1 [Mercurialis annua]